MTAAPHKRSGKKKKNYNTWVCTTLDRLACKWPQIASSALWWKETGMKEEEIETEPGRRRKGLREREMCEAPERGELHGPPRWCDYHWFTGRTDLHTSLPPISLSRQDGSGRLLNVNISSIRRHGTERNEEPENKALKNEDLDEDILYYSKYKNVRNQNVNLGEFKVKLAGGYCHQQAKSVTAGGQITLYWLHFWTESGPQARGLRSLP